MVNVMPAGIEKLELKFNPSKRIPVIGADSFCTVRPAVARRAEASVGRPAGAVFDSVLATVVPAGTETLAGRVRAAVTPAGALAPERLIAEPAVTGAVVADVNEAIVGTAGAVAAGVGDGVGVAGAGVTRP